MAVGEIKCAVGPIELRPGLGPYLADKIYFRHFRPGELWLAKEFVRKELIYGTYYFDVYLFTEEALDWIQRHPEEFWRMVIPYCHRIDCVIFEEDKIRLVEFKIRLKYSAIGQLMGYLDWFKRQYAPTKPVVPTVVYSLERVELHDTCRRLGIELIRLR